MMCKHRTLFILFVLIFCVLQTVLAGEKPKAHLGGALRFNYNYSDWKEGNKHRGGDFGFDVFRINVNASWKKIRLDAEYRFYARTSGGGMLKYGWVGYQFNDNHVLQLGQNTVPFGAMPFNSNNYFFSINYYLGLEDDADMGLKYCFRKKGWELDAAFYKNADLLDFSEGVETSDSRYAYDIAGRNKEVNQGNLRVAYNWGERWKHQIGASAMYGGIYNLDTEKMGSRYAFAIHYTLNWKRWNLKAQYTTYKFSPENKEDEPRNQITMTAYGAPYEIAAHADTYTASLCYTFPIDKGILDEMRLYNDFSMMHKRKAGFNDSFQNITGCMLGMGPVLVYVDYALGKNQPWLGNDWNEAFTSATLEKGWNARLNVNIGYYF